MFELYWKMLLEQASVNTDVCYICGDFHSWVEIRHAALMIWHPCQNAKMSGFLTDKHLCVKRTSQKNTLPRYQNYESRGIHDIILENGSKIVPKQVSWSHALNQPCRDPLVWPSWKATPPALASGRSVTTRRSMLVQKAVNGNQPWSYCRWVRGGWRLSWLKGLLGGNLSWSCSLVTLMPFYIQST